MCPDASACCGAGRGEPEGPGTSADGRGTDPGCQGQCQTRSHVSEATRAPLDLRVCAGGAAASSGGLRCFDPPASQARPSAQPGCRPSRLRLQEGGLERRREPRRRGPARHRLQPGVPLLGRAQSESHLFAMWDASVRLSTHVTVNFQDAFGDLALFFCDPHGGTLIAVLWKPKAFVPIPFKVRLHLLSFLVFLIGCDYLPNYI